MIAYKKMLQTCKPDSVSLSFDKLRTTGGYHLSCCYITATILLPTLPDIPSESYRDENINEQLILPFTGKSGIYVALQHTRFTHRNNYLLPS